MISTVPVSTTRMDGEGTDVGDCGPRYSGVEITFHKPVPELEISLMRSETPVKGFP